MAIVGHTNCEDCDARPDFKLHPCKHLSCYEHYFRHCEAIDKTCSSCGQHIVYVEPLHPEPSQPVGIRDPTWSSELSSGDASGVLVGGSAPPNMYPGRGGTQNGAGGNGKGYPTRNNYNQQPARGSQTDQPNGNKQQQHVEETPTHAPRPYVAPHRRNPVFMQNPYVDFVPSEMSDLDPEIRPDSSASNTTFLSQIPYSNVGSNAGTGDSLPSGNYVYGPRSMTDPFVDTQNASPPQHYIRGGETMMAPNFSTANRGRLAPVHPPANMHQYSTGKANVQIPLGGGGAPMPHSINGTPSHARSNRLHTPPNNVNAFGPNNIPSTNSSANDSGLANSNAIRLANLIRGGAADDPQDVDYGNPGRSHRLPAESINPVGEQLPKRGKIGNDNAMMKASTVDNIKGSAAAFVGSDPVPLPDWWAGLSQGYIPTVDEVFADLPVISACIVVEPTTAGVIKITNIPYAISSSEIVAFLGRNVGIVSQPEGSPYHAVHIVMDRFTGKTMDAYVELKTSKEVAWVVNQFDRRTKNGRQAKLGDRAVKVEATSQAELQAIIFPQAKNVVWEGPVPKIDTSIPYYYKNVPSSGFAGFLQAEELTALTKYAETPSRSPFAQRCLVRIYENIITILHKYPWFAIEHVFLHERHALYDTAIRSINALMSMLRKNTNERQPDPTKPTPIILQELVVAALTCPGFSEGMKTSIVYALSQGGFGHLSMARGMNLRFGGNHKYAAGWPFHVLVMKPGAASELVEYVAGLLQDASTTVNALSLAQIASQRSSAAANKKAMFGTITPDYSTVNTIAETGLAEFNCIEELLSRVLPRPTRQAPAPRSRGFSSS